MEYENIATKNVTLNQIEIKYYETSAMTNDDWKNLNISILLLGLHDMISILYFIKTQISMLLLKIFVILNYFL